MDELNQKETLEIAALSLYWGEGAKSLRAGVVDLVNSEVEMLQLFLEYLRKVVLVDEKRLRVYLYCFEDQDCKKLKKFWSEKLSIPLKQFTRPYIRCRTINTGRSMSYGVAHVRYNDKKLLKEILSKIEKMKLWAGCRAVKCTRL